MLQKTFGSYRFDKEGLLSEADLTRTGSTDPDKEYQLSGADLVNAFLFKKKKTRADRTKKAVSL